MILRRTVATSTSIRGTVGRLLLALATAPILAGCGWHIVPSPGDDPLALPSEALAPPAGQYAGAVEQVQLLARNLIIDENLPGVSIAVAVDGELAWAEVFGWSDLRERVPLTPRTRFRIGGVSKPMTAAAVGLLHQRGRVDLDAPVRAYVPSLPESGWPVTTRQLMGHVAGVGHYGGGEAAQVNPDDRVASRLARLQPCEAVTDAFDLFAADPLRFEPGTSYRYSSYGWVLVSAVVEAAADEPFLDFMNREVFAALGMPDTMLDAPGGPVGRHGHAVPGRAGLYFPGFAMNTRYGLQDAPNIDHTCLFGADGFISTPIDLARFGMAMLRNDLLEPDTIELLQTEGRLESGEPTGYGLGWFVRRVSLNGRPVRVIGHGGSAVGGSTSFTTFPDQGLVIAVTSSVSFAEEAVRSLALATAEAFAGRE
jgi:CubicO group peptidase (beta-lactamase class C family)